MSGPLVLGIDVSPLRLGWGLVTLDEGEPVACGCESIDLPDHGWLHEQVTVALEAIPLDPSVLASDGSFTPGDTIAAVYVEEPALPPKSGTESAFKAGRAVQAAVVCVARRWPWAWPDDPAAMSERMLKPTQWRKASGLPGNAPKDDVGVRARELLSDRDVVTQDSADALLIALAGQRINAETWDRAVGLGRA